MRLPRVADLPPDVATQSGLPLSCAGSRAERALMDTMRPELHVALIVEDDPYVRELAAALLGETDFDMVEVEDAEAALAYLKNRGGEVAMMFADIRLPGMMDGVQLAKAACTLWPTIRIVLTSGDPDALSDDLPDCITFMPKPWRGLDVLVEAERAAHQPQPPVA
jgi:DNA-binding NtrC family response regulator